MKLNPRIAFFDSVEYSLTEKRILLAQGMIDDAFLTSLRARLVHLTSVSKKPITIYLNTVGGLITSGLGAYDLILSMRKVCPVNIMATGSCMSMGVVVLQAGTKRLATPHTTFLLHELQLSTGGALSKVLDDQTQAKRMQDTLDGIIEKRTGQNMTKLRQLFMRRDYYLNTAEMLKHRLIDGIVGGE
jgi:ATP-dependent Clp protease protease subunit